MTQQQNQQQGVIPEWLSQRCAEIKANLATLPAPSRSRELWRFGLVPDFVTEGVPSSSERSSEATLPGLPSSLIPNALRVVCHQGVPIDIPSELPEGLHICDLGTFATLFPDEAELILNVTPEVLGSEQALARILSRTDIGVVILAETHIPQPLELIHYVSGDQTLTPLRTIILTKTGAKLRVLEHHVSADDGAHFCAALQELNIASCSTLHYALVQNLNDYAKALELTSIQADDSSETEHLVTHPGAAKVRQETVCTLKGADARVQLYSANLATGSKVIDQRTRQHHPYRGASSNLFYANVSDDSARSVFGGMIVVAGGAHDTSAYQSNRNLLLSPNASADSLPGLEILADRVQCSHGSATSSISPEEIFYLLSRGIPESVARCMIAQGFLRNALERFSDPEIRSAVEKCLLPNADSEA